MKDRHWFWFALIVVIFLCLPGYVMAEDSTVLNFGIWSLLPALLAMFGICHSPGCTFPIFGAFVGVVMLEGGNVFSAFLTLLSKYLVGALTDSFHAGILIFLMVLGSVVGIIGRMGGLKLWLILLEGWPKMKEQRSLPLGYWALWFSLMTTPMLWWWALQ